MLTFKKYPVLHMETDHVSSNKWWHFSMCLLLIIVRDVSSGFLLQILSPLDPCFLGRAASVSSGVWLSVVILEGQSHTYRLIVDSAIVSIHLELRGNHSLFYQSEWETVSTCSGPQWYFRSDFSPACHQHRDIGWGGRKVNCTAQSAISDFSSALMK